MSERRRQWLAVAVTGLLVLAMVVGWGGYLRARATPHYMQVPPGAVATPEQGYDMPMRLVSLTVTPALVTNREVNYAQAGAVWVIAVVDYTPPPEGGFCRLHLIATDGRAWSSIDSLGYEGERVLPTSCSAKPGEGTPRVELIYLIPETAATQLAGLASSATAYRGTDPFWTLTPAG